MGEKTKRGLHKGGRDRETPGHCHVMGKHPLSRWDEAAAGSGRPGRFGRFKGEANRSDDLRTSRRAGRKKGERRSALPRRPPFLPPSPTPVTSRFFDRYLAEILRSLDWIRSTISREPLFPF